MDDEKHVRDAIKLLVDWSAFGIDDVLEAADGESAIALIAEERPQIVYTDMMMPNTDGLSLLRWIHEHAPECKTIVISGHDDFEFVRGAVKYGGMDYLLKPIDAGQLHEITEKAVQSWNEDERERLESQMRSIRMNSLRPVYRDKLLSSLVDEPGSYYDAKASFAQEFPELAEGAACRIAVVAADTMHGKLRDKFAAHTDLLLFSLTNICNEMIGEPRQGFAFRYWNTHYPIALLVWSRPERLPQLLESINDGLHRTFQARVEFGVGDAHPFPAGAKRSFAEAETALRHRNLLKRTAWIHPFDPNEPSRSAELHFSDFDDQVRLAIRSASKEKIEEAIRGWIERVRSTNAVTMEHLDLWKHEFQVLKSRWVKEFFPGDDAEKRLPLESADLPIPLNDRGELSLERWQEEMTDSLVRLAELVRKAAQQENNLIYDIAKYVQSRLDSDISVQEVAAHFYLSREYVSRRFKQEFGETISDFILRHRMERAKTLLLNPSLKIAQVAHMVGYDDEKYFSKVFKKAVGATPAEYRRKPGD
ncbi:helix-turn-helix domain-containing protein [Paenibacillus flagellatus]|uniref:helix-turn-helix domain-containing protein n=1 Tax=Paenibacillus flagellatus TaxID=2211139 RepID=UPI0013051E1A|nr:helix-turn-helix domain-containing protein [Paenibacillus flagellatus]